MIKQFFILFVTLFMGYLIVYFTGIPIPANVIGLLLLFIALCTGVVKLKHVDKVSEFVIKYLAIFFVVPTVGIMVYLDLIASEAVKILVPLLVSILLGFFVAGKSTEICIKILEKFKSKHTGELEEK